MLTTVIENDVVTMNFRNGDMSVSYVAKRIWQQLFKIYRDNGGELDKLFDLLCDLAQLERFLGNPTKIPKCWWYFDTNGYTELESFYSDRSVQYEIDWNGTKFYQTGIITIRKVVRQT